MATCHPNYFFNAEEIASLRIRIRSNYAMRRKYEAITKDKEKLLAEDFLTEEYANSVYDQHGRFCDVSWQLERMNEVLGSVYLIEGDNCCAEKIRDLLLHLATFTRWAGPDNPYQEVPRKSELTTAHIVNGAAYAFDIIYPILSETERRTIADAIIQKGVMPLMEDWVLHGTRIHAMDSMGHNWWAVCIAKGAAALLPVADYMEAGQADAILDAAEEALIHFLNYPGCTLYNKPCSFDEKGLFYECVNYFSFGTGELLRYIYHAERYRGRREDLRAALPEGMDRAILSFAYPTTEEPKLKFLDYGDSTDDCGIDGMMRWLVLLGYDTPQIHEYITRRRPQWDFFELMHPELHTPGHWDEMPLTAFYPTTGYAFARDAWKDDSTLFSVKSGYTWNHAHADAGHFILWDRGTALFPDSACCSYDSKLYRSYYCKDEGHNVLLIGGEGQNPEDQYRGNKFPGKLFDTYKGKDFVYIGADATGPLAHLCARCYRNFLLIENRYLVIIDDVRCHKENTVQFLLHHAGSFTDDIQNGLPCTHITAGNTGADIYHVWPENISVSEVIGVTDTKEDGSLWEAKHLEFSTTEDARSILMMHVIALRPADNRLGLKRLADENALGVELREPDNGITRRIWFNLLSDGRRMHLNSNNVIDGFETDAYFFMRTLQGFAEEDFLACASYHRRPGETGFGSYTKQTDIYLP